MMERDLSNWRPTSLVALDDIFKDSKLKKEQNLPYWATVNIEFLNQAINAYSLQKQLAVYSENTLMKHLQKHGAIKI